MSTVNSSSDKTEAGCVAVIKDSLINKIRDLVDSPKGEMTLYSPSKNMRIEVVDKQKITKIDYTRFENLIDKLHPSVAVFISFSDKIPYKIKPIIKSGKLTLEIYISVDYIDDHFVEMLANQDDLPEEIEMMNAIENSKKKVKESVIESYEPTIEGFNSYCKNVPISKIEYGKAKSKWPRQMESYEDRTKFIEYIRADRQLDSKQTKGTSTVKSTLTKGTSTVKSALTKSIKSKGSVNEFYNYIRETAISKITKKDIRENFAELSDEITFLDKTGNDFKEAIKNLKASL